jgi:hypothetical protein
MTDMGFTADILSQKVLRCRAGREERLDLQTLHTEYVQEPIWDLAHFW